VSEDTLDVEGVRDCPACKGRGTAADGSLCQTCGGSTVQAK